MTQTKTNNPIQKNELYIVEGYTDVISMHNAGFKNTVAPLGTAISVKQIIYSWRISKEPTLCMDGDEAGRKAIETYSTLLKVMEPSIKAERYRKADLENLREQINLHHPFK